MGNNYSTMDDSIIKTSKRDQVSTTTEPQKLYKTRFRVLAAAIVAFVFLSFLILPALRDTSKQPFAGSPIVPEHFSEARHHDPLLHPIGALDVANNTFLWIPMEKQISPPKINDVFVELEKSDTALPEHLKDRFVVVVGDSNDRNIVDYLCHMAHGELVYLSVDGSIPVPAVTKTGRMCVVRRENHVLVWFLLFHFGVTTDGEGIKGGNQHAQESQHENAKLYPIDTLNRLALLKPAIESLAANFFPELCVKHGYRCVEEPRYKYQNSQDESEKHLEYKSRIDPGVIRKHESLLQAPRAWTPPPDIVIASSTIWDLYYYRNRNPQEFMPSFAPRWSRQLEESLTDPLEQMFGARRTMRYLRTTPLPKDAWTHKTGVNILNAALRRQTASSSLSGKWNVLDWDALTAGYDLHADNIHLNEGGQKAFLQLVFSKFLTRREETK